MRICPVRISRIRISPWWICLWCGMWSGAGGMRPRCGQRVLVRRKTWMAKSPMTWRMASEPSAIRERPGRGGWVPVVSVLTGARLGCQWQDCAADATCVVTGAAPVGSGRLGRRIAVCREHVAPVKRDAAGCCEAGVMSGERDRAGVVPAKRQVRRSCRPGPADTPVEKTVVRPAGRDVVLFDRAGESGEFGGRVVPRAGPWGFGGYLLMLTRSPRRESEAEMMRELAWKPR